MNREPLVLMLAVSLLASTVVVGNTLTPQANAQQHRNISKENPSSNFTSLQSAGTTSNNFTLNYVKSVPINITSDQLKKMQFGVEGADVSQPAAPITNSSIQGPVAGTETKPGTANNTKASTGGLITQGNTTTSNPSLRVDPPGDIRVDVNTLVGGVEFGSAEPEPSVANNERGLVFYTSNFFVSKSTDRGNHWEYAGVSTPPSPNGPFKNMNDFCCDQDVVYDHNRHIFIWYRQAWCNAPTTVRCDYQPPSPAPRINHANHFRLSISRDAVNWWYYDVYPTLFSTTWNNQWWDFPHLALSNNNLYFSSNVFNGIGSHTVLARVSLDSLASASTIFFQYLDLGRGAWTATPVQGAIDTMYFGKTDPRSNDHFIIYKWPDSSASIYTYYRTIPSWTPSSQGSFMCAAPDGNNWCARSDNRVLNGWIWNDIVGFFWNAANDTQHGFPYPYVNAATFETRNDLAYRSSPIIWNRDVAWVYPYASPNSRGLGIAAFFGGGGYYPTQNVMIADSSVSCCPTPPYHTWYIASSTNAINEWGDYIRVRPYTGSTFHWVGTGYTDTRMANTPRFFVFGDVVDGVPPH
jgi:hypothetical protein